MPLASNLGQPNSTEISLSISIYRGRVYMTETWQSSQLTVGTRARHFPQPILYAFPSNLGGLPG